MRLYHVTISLRDRVMRAVVEGREVEGREVEAHEVEGREVEGREVGHTRHDAETKNYVSFM